MKPKPEPRYAIDYNKAAEWIESLLGYPLDDTLRSEEHYGDWCSRHGEACDESSQEQYARYRAADDGEAQCPEFRSFWHFLIDCGQTGEELRITSDLLERAEPWQAEIVQAFVREFGEEAIYRR